MATIKAIEGRSVHQIQSGQVIVDLSSVVKELIENSLDAGARSIEVRFKNHGLDSIEVQDNGNGISPEDFDTVALKHHTSKLSSYEDLSSLDTFGFRGEALSSLCALSKFHILTARAEDGALGKKLDFEASGKLKTTSIAASQKGTTVYVENLFFNIPVRRKELEKNIKREYGKVIAYLYAYACICVGTRFTVSNQMPKGKRISTFSTKSNTTTKENIANIFGAKTLSALVKLDMTLEMEPSTEPGFQSARTSSTKASDDIRKVRIEGHISRPVFGEGRQAPDRQMFFVNSRPCQLPQVSKAFNEVYKTFNVSQSPFIFANIVMNTQAYDVNVSPDKRTILLHDQTALLNGLKDALTDMFENTEHTVPQSTLPDRKMPSYQPLPGLRQRSTESKEEASLERLDGNPNSKDREEDSNEHDSDNDSKLETSTDSEVSTSQSGLIHNWVGRGCAERRPESVLERLGGRDQFAQSEVLERFGGSHGDDIPEEIANAGVEHEESDEESRESQAHSDRTHLQANSPVLRQENSEQTIAAFMPSSQKSIPGSVQNAFDRMRPKRTPIQTAVITVGDQKLTTTIGSSPPYKKRRVHNPESSQAVAHFGGSPHHALGLRNNFAAPGSTIDVNSSSNNKAKSGLAGNFELSEGEDEDDGKNDEVSDEEIASESERNKVAHRITLAKSHGRELDDELVPLADKSDSDEEYVDEAEKKIIEDERIARLIQVAEKSAAVPGAENWKRASQVLKNNGNRKAATLHVTTSIAVSLDDIKAQLAVRSQAAQTSVGDIKRSTTTIIKDEIDTPDAEHRLSLIVSKDDFGRMRVIGQFNLGFILAVRPAGSLGEEDDLFIIDQHAADEKYNYERLQRTATLQSQRLVRPKILELTAFDEEVVLNHSEALKANGFEIDFTNDIDDAHDEEDSDHAVFDTTRTFRLLTLPTSHQTTFALSDLEELIHLLSETDITAGSSRVPRPSKVQKMLAMRACRSSIMVGKTLDARQMIKVVRNMGEMEKPWNCPHGRPTMRHLARMGSWRQWNEGDHMDDYLDPDMSDDYSQSTQDDLTTA